ncbi:MAG: hypothetical protein ACTSQY_02510 [Candidatus Odinarchaeia archaeon]
MTSGLSVKIASKYPWSKIASEFVKQSDIKLNELTADSPEVKYTISRLMYAIRFTSSITDELNKELTNSPYAPYSFPICNIILSVIGDRMLIRRWGVFESKIANYNLENERPEIIEKLAKTSFNWNVKLLSEKEKKDTLKKTGMNYDFTIVFTDFLTVNTSFHDLRWKICNQIVTEGKVLLTINNLARLISEKIKIKLSSRKTIKIRGDELTEDFLRSINELNNKWEQMKKDIGVESVKISGPIVKEYFPPCISDQISKILTGENISHQGRFALTSFLLNIGMSEMEILDIFRNSPDCDEKKALYQIRHIKGTGLEKSRYTPPSCKTLKTYGLCVNMDNICRRVKHPLQYYKLRKKISRSKRGGE